MNKKGITLSINFVVMLVLSVAILSGSLFVIYKFFGKAEEMKLKMDTQTEAEINSLLYSGEKVAIPFNHKTVRKNKFATFGIGVLNVLPETRDFVVTIQHNNLDGVDCDDIAPTPITAEDSITFTLPPNKQHVELVGFDTSEDGVERCTYVYNVMVSTTVAAYDERTHKMYLKVE